MEQPTEPIAMRELQAASLGGTGEPMAPAMALAVAASFGSVDKWRDEFVAVGKAAGAAAGWSVLCFDPQGGGLVNQCSADDAPLRAGAVPLLALNIKELASVESIDWTAVYARYQKAVHAATEGLAVERGAIKDACLLDVRRAGVFEQAAQMIPNAQWRDPSAVTQWAADLPKDREVIVYCVYGHEVGRSTALRLRAQGVQARFLEGGIDGWKTAGLPLADKPPVA